MLLIKNSYLVEVNLPTVSNGLRVYFPDVPKLRNASITGLDAVYSQVLSISPNGKNMITAPRALMLTLAVTGNGNDEKMYQMPYYDLVGSLNGGIVKEVNRWKVNLQKSYITIADSSLLTATQSAAVVFYYE